MKKFLIKYKWLITLGVPLLFLVLFISFITFPISRSNQSDKTPSIKLNPTTKPVFLIKTDSKNAPIERGEDFVEARPGLLKKEDIANGITRYTFKSHIADRPNIILAKGKDDIIFQSAVTLPTITTKIIYYTKPYGQPRWIFKGSKFYGPDAQTYIYPELGIAFIGNPKTGDVLEQHVFYSTKVEDYVKNFGDDIPAQP